MLTSEEIRHALEIPGIIERLIVTPLLDPSVQIGPASIDLRLGTEFLQPRTHDGLIADPVLTDLPDARMEAQVVPLGSSFVVHPGQFVLGSTLEFVRIPSSLAGQVHSRSSWGRVGLVVTTAAGIQPGYTGMVTLELVNQGSVPIALYPGMRVAQLFLWRTSAPANQTYDAEGVKYRRPLGPQASRLACERPELRRLQGIGAQLGVSIPASRRPTSAANDIATDEVDFDEGGTE